jgi:anti-sigma factor RsiW
MPQRSGARTITPRTCREITKLIADYLNDRLPAAVKRDFAQHLRICPDCVSFLKTYRKTVAAAQSIPIEEVPAKVRKNVLDFLRKKVHHSGAFLLAAAQILHYWAASYR